MVTRSIPAKVEARVILNPVDLEGEFSVDPEYIPKNLPIPCSSVSVSYARNTVPTASVQLVVGRRDFSDLQASIGHSISRRLIRNVDILIEARLTGDKPTTAVSSEDGFEVEAWQDSFFTLFDGSTSAVNLLRALQDSSYRLTAVNWMAVLADSSILSDDLHQSAPAFMFMKPGFGISSFSAGWGSLSSKPSAQDIVDDLWGKAILPFFEELARGNRAKVNLLDLLNEEESSAFEVQLNRERGNRAALSALARFERFETDRFLNSQQIEEAKTFRDNHNFKADKDPDLDAISLDETIALLFDTVIDEGNAAKEIPTFPLTISRELKSQIRDFGIRSTLKTILTRDARTNDTFWGRLLQLAQTFQFSIIPGVNRSGVVPVMATGTRDPFVFIRAGEITRIEISSSTDRLPRGMVLWNGNASSFAGAIGGYVATATPILAFSGKYDLKKELELDLKNQEAEFGDLQKKSLEANIKSAEKGLWLFRKIPMWLDGYTALDAVIAKHYRSKPENEPSKSTAAGIEKPVTDEQGEEIKDKPPDVATKKEKERALAIGDRFAKDAFLNEIFRTRVAVLSGRFRVDICPGSTVRFQTMGENIQNLPLTAGYIGELQGLVEQVTLQLDSEASVAATTFSISHVKNESELIGKAFSPLLHPVYNQEFRGGRLVPEDSTGRLRSLFEERQSVAPSVRILSDLQKLATAVRAGGQAIANAFFTARLAAAAKSIEEKAKLKQERAKEPLTSEEKTRLEARETIVSPGFPGV